VIRPAELIHRKRDGAEQRATAVLGKRGS